MAASVGSLSLILSASTDALVGGLKRADALITGFASKSGRMLSGIAGGIGGGDPLAALGHGLLGAIRGIPKVGELIAGVLEGGAALGQLAAGAETAKMRLSALFGSVEQGATAFAEIKKLSLASGFGMDQLEPAARYLAQAGVSADLLIPDLKALATVAAATGQDVGELAHHIGRVVETGRVTARDLRVLSGPVLKQLAENAGVSTNALHDLAEQGKLGPKELLKALGDVTQEGGKLAGALTDRAKTIQGSWDLMSTHLRDVFGELGRVMVEGFGGDLGGGAAGITAFFDNVKAGIQDIKPLFEWMSREAREGWAVYQTAWEDFGRPALDAFKGLLGQVGLQLGDFAITTADAWRVVALGGAYLYDACRLGAAGYVMLEAKGLEAGGQLLTVGAVLLRMLKGLVVAVTGMAQIAGDAFTDGLITPLTQGLELLARKVRLTLAVAVAALGGEDKAPAWLLSARNEARDLDRLLQDMAANPPRWQPPDVGGWIDALADGTERWGKILDKAGDNLRNIGKDLADAPFGDAADKVDAWFAKVRERAKGGIQGPEIQIDAPMIDLGADAKASLGKVELHSAGALEQGSKEAYSAILKFQNQGAEAARRQKEEADRKAQLLALQAIDRDVQAMIRAVREQAQPQVVAM